MSDLPGLCRSHVLDRTGNPASAATFYGPDAGRFAREHAERLNREVGS